MKKERLQQTMQKYKGDYYEQLHGNKMDNLEEIDRLLEQFNPYWWIFQQTFVGTCYEPVGTVADSEDTGEQGVALALIEATDSKGRQIHKGIILL